MSSELSSLRQTQTVQVFALLARNPDLTVADACDQIGISKDQYYYWIRKEDSAINRVRELIGDNQRELLVDLVNIKMVAMEKLIEDAKKDHLKPGERIKILRYIDEQLEELQSVHHARPGIEESAHEFLKEGPILREQSSVKTSLEIRSSGKDGVIVDVISHDDIVDAEFDQDPPQEPLQK